MCGNTRGVTLWTSTLWTSTVQIQRFSSLAGWIDQGQGQARAQGWVCPLVTGIANSSGLSQPSNAGWASVSEEMSSSFPMFGNRSSSNQSQDIVVVQVGLCFDKIRIKWKLTVYLNLIKVLISPSVEVVPRGRATVRQGMHCWSFGWLEPTTNFWSIGMYCSGWRWSNSEVRLSDLLIIVPCVIFVQCGNHEGRVWTAEKAQCSTRGHSNHRVYRGSLCSSRFASQEHGHSAQNSNLLKRKEVDNIPPAEANVSTTLHTFHV